MAIVNVVGSTIAREADHIFYTLAGPEIAVATTKAYSTQLVAGYLLGVQFALPSSSRLKYWLLKLLCSSNSISVMPHFSRM